MKTCGFNLQDWNKSNEEIAREIHRIEKELMAERIEEKPKKKSKWNFKNLITGTGEKNMGMTDFRGRL